MKKSYIAVLVALLMFGCSRGVQHTPPKDHPMPDRFDHYLQGYADALDNRDIGGSPRDTYHYRIRQQIKKSDDPELKRVYVMYEMHMSLNQSIRHFEEGIVMTGQDSSRCMTPDEWQTKRQELLARVNDLAAYTAFTNYQTRTPDIMDESTFEKEVEWVEELRQRIDKAKTPNKGMHGIR